MSLTNRGFYSFDRIDTPGNTPPHTSYMLSWHLMVNLLLNECIEGFQIEVHGLEHRFLAFTCFTLRVRAKYK